MGQTEYKFRTVERSNQELPDEEVQEDVEEQAVMIRVRLVLMIQQQGRKEATNDEVSIIFSDRPPRFRRTSSSLSLSSSTLLSISWIYCSYRWNLGIRRVSTIAGI